MALLFESTPPAPAERRSEAPALAARRTDADASTDVLAVSPAGAFGSVEQVILTAASGASGHGWKTTLACPAGELSEQASAGGLAIESVEVCGLTRAEIGRSLQGWSRSVQQLRRARRAVLEAAEITSARILHVHHPAVAIQAARAARALRIPLIWHVHQTGPLPLAYRALGEAAIGACDMLIGVSNAACEMVRGLGAPQARIRRIYNAADRRFFGRIRPADGPFGQGPNIGAFGILEPGKGHGDLIRACAALAATWPGLQLWIEGGPGLEPSGYPGSLQALARELGVGERVHFLGRRDDTPELMARMDAVVSAAVRHEGLPTVLIEACAAGRPVLATDVGGAREIVRHGATGLLARPGAPRELAGNLEILLSAAGRRMAERAQAEARLRFSFSRFAADLDDCYAELAGARPELPA